MRMRNQRTLRGSSLAFGCVFAPNGTIWRFPPPPSHPAGWRRY